MEKNCPYCQQILLEKSTYCGSCGKQARCKSCRAIVLPNASFCDECGTRIGEAGTVAVDDSAASPDSSVNTADGAVNTVQFEETNKGRSLHAKLTNEAVADLSGAFGQFIASQSGTGGNRERKRPTLDAPLVNPQQLTAPDVNAGNGKEEDEPVIEAELQHEQPLLLATAPNLQKIGEFFRRDGDQLKLDDSRLKATGKLDFAKRLTFLFLYAWELYERPKVSRAELNSILQKEAVYDSNFINWLGKTSELRIENDVIELRREGREQAQKILQEALDSKIENVWTPNSQARHKQGKNERGSENKDAEKGPATKSSASKTAKVPADVVAWVTKWKASDVNVDGHSAIKDRKLAEKGIFGLWAIRHVMGDAGKVVSRTKLAHFLYEAFEVKASDRSLEEALKTEFAKDKVLNVRGTMFQILPPGMEYGGNLAGLADNSVPVPTKEAGKEQT